MKDKSLVISVMKKMPPPGKMGDEESGDAKEEAGKAMIDAMKSGDGAGFAELLVDFVANHCGGSSDEDEGEEA